jgi:Transposase DDE domain
MDMEFWAELSRAISDVDQRITPNRRDTHRTSLIVRVHLWSALHDRPTCWACRKENWTSQSRPRWLPDQSTLSRRMRRKDFEQFLVRMGRRLNGAPRQQLLKIVDGKPLELPNHTGDPDARWGRGVSRQSVGYKLHAIYSSQNPMPDAFIISSLDVCEKKMAGRMIKRVKGAGYVLGDSHYDASWLFDCCSDHEHQLLCPRGRPGTGLGHHYQAPDRLRAIDLLEPPAQINPFGLKLYARRKNIEREFGQLVCFGGGLAALPSWVRRIWRVRRWVWAKLLINAARIRLRLAAAG